MDKPFGERGVYMADQITNYKCPACTGPLHFAGNSGKMECEYCGSIYEVDEIESLYEAENAKAEKAKEKADAAAAAPKDEWEVSTDEWNGEGMKTYNCPSCGADLVCEETLAASSCPYCGNPTIVPGQFTGMLKPDYVVPFKLEKNDALEALKKHYGNRFLLPKAFKDNNHLEEVKGVYVPFWLYDGESQGDCLYEAYTTQTRREGSDEVTIKKIYSVERKGNLRFEKIPADASTRMDDALMDSIEPYNYADIKPFSKAYLTGYLADKYDVTAEENAARAVGRAKESTRRAILNDVTGYSSVSPRKEDIHVEQGKVSYAMMPVWLLNTKWNGQDFMFAMNGQTGKLVGDLPVDKAKLTITSIIVFLATFFISMGLIGLSGFVSFISGAVITAIVAMVLYGGMKSVASATAADAYISDGSIEITHRKDTFIRQEVSRRKVDK